MREVIVYVGTFGGFYMTKETADFFGAAKKQNQNTFALILTQSKAEMIQPLLDKYGYTEKDFFIQKVSPDEISKYLSAADIGVSFIKPCYSKLSSSPTKNAEYLAYGLPIVGNTGVGDVGELLEENKVGVVLTEFNEKAYIKALNGLEDLLSLNNIQANCRRIAQEEFDLEEVGGESYRNLYKRLMQ